MKNHDSYWVSMINESTNTIVFQCCTSSVLPDEFSLFWKMAGDVLQREMVKNNHYYRISVKKLT